MTFAHPLYLVVAVAAAAAFLAFVWRAERRSKAAALAYSQLAFLEAVAGPVRWTAVFAGVWTLAIALLGIALARPSIVAAVPVHDASVVLCIDTSGSMAATDVRPTRAEAARAAASAFIAEVPEGTRIGIVAFGTTAVRLGAATDQLATAQENLNDLPPPNGETAIGDALAVAADMLPPVGRRAIVLVTDGVNNHGRDPLETAHAIGASGITIFTIGIGTNGSGRLVPGTGESAALDEDALQAIAVAGNGTYARAADADALRSRLVALSQTTVRERRRVEISLPLAVGGGLLGAIVTLCAAAMGRFP